MDTATRLTAICKKRDRLFKITADLSRRKFPFIEPKTTTTTTATAWLLRPCLPEVLRAEGSVQVRVHVSRALLHGPRVGDERLGLDPPSLNLGAVLHPQVDERHAGHLVAVRPPKDRHLPGRAQAHAAVVVVVIVGGGGRGGGGCGGGRGHGCTVDDGTVAQSGWRPWLVAQASLGEQSSKVFQLELRSTLCLNA